MVFGHGREVMQGGKFLRGEGGSAGNDLLSREVQCCQRKEGWSLITIFGKFAGGVGRLATPFLIFTIFQQVLPRDLVLLSPPSLINGR